MNYVWLMGNFVIYIYIFFWSDLKNEHVLNKIQGMYLHPRKNP